MMKLKYSICCGLDVHKNVIVATIVTTNKDGISEYLQKSFSTINSDIQRFHNWLIENNCYHVCMESTGKYWIPIFNYLENDIDVCLTHPKYVKAIKGKKTDKKDSKWIADLYKFDLVRCSFIPPKDFRQLRELSRYRFKLVCMKSSEKNRIQNCMTISNVGIASVLSDPFGKTATEIISYLLEHTADSMDEKAVRKLIMRIPTDSTPVEDPKPTEGSVILQLYKLFASAQGYENMVRDFQNGGCGYGDFKKRLFDAYWEYFRPARERRAELEANQDYVRRTLEEGARKARETASVVLDRVRRAVGLA